MKDKPRITRLYIPGNNPSIMQNIAIFGADTVILDLEDAVPPSNKDAARILVKYALNNVDFGYTEKGVRINSLISPYGKEDLKMAVENGAEIIFLPKVEDSLDIKEVVDYIGDREIWLAPILESAKGILNASRIANASKRIAMVCFGAEDFTRDIGVERTKEGMELLLARQTIVLAAKSAGIQASDTVFSDINDMEGLINETTFVKSLGFDGKGAIHPLQIEPIHRVFMPSSTEIEYAKKVVEAIKEARRKGSGVIALGRKMIDKPVVERAKRVLKLAEMAGLIDKSWRENGDN
ncbi:MAG: CoA ester lyase [candidate division WOR-3 bacterium]|nr:CoA ester lyase [candidate division WOR-3 bacterium]